MNGIKRVVIVGATSTIAEHCARLWLQRQAADLTLVGRDSQRIAQVARDLRVRNRQAVIRTVQADFLTPDSIDATVREIVESGRVDVVLIAHGSLCDQAECQSKLRSCRDGLEINAISPVLFAEAFAREMERFDYGTIAMIGSVAGDRGRKSNYVYGAAKALVTRYAQGLQHRFSGSGVKVVLIKPGPTQTSMTAKLGHTGARLASVELVARLIVEEIEAGKTAIYAPKEWRFIMMIVRHLPAFVFNKLRI